MTPGPDDAKSDRRDDAAEKPRRLRMRIRDWLVAVVLVALVAAGMAEVIRARRLRVERELAEAIRLKEALKAAREREAVKKAEEWLKKAKNEGMEIPQEDRDGVFPDPGRKGRPNDGRTDL